jgi:hypothetical protein
MPTVSARSTSAFGIPSDWLKSSTPCSMQDT